jgi:hypothetical protein
MRLRARLGREERLDIDTRKPETRSVASGVIRFGWDGREATVRDGAPDR